MAASASLRFAAARDALFTGLLWGTMAIVQGTGAWLFVTVNGDWVNFALAGAGVVLGLLA